MHFVKQVALDRLVIKFADKRSSPQAFFHPLASILLIDVGTLFFSGSIVLAMATTMLAVFCIQHRSLIRGLRAWTAGTIALSLGSALFIAQSFGSTFLSIVVSNGLVLFGMNTVALGTSRFAERTPSWWIKGAAGIALLTLGVLLTFTVTGVPGLRYRMACMGASIAAAMAAGIRALPRRLWRTVPGGLFVGMAGLLVLLGPARIVHSLFFLSPTPNILQTSPTGVAVVLTMGYLLGTAGVAFSLALLVPYRLYEQQRTLYQREKALKRVVAQQADDLEHEQAATRQALDTVEQQAAELAERNANKARFFTNVSHELRTPLTLIQAPADRLRSPDSLPIATRRELARTIVRNSRRLETLTQQLLHLAQYDEERLPLTLHRYTLARFLERIAQQFRPYAQAQGIDFAVDGPAPDAQVAFDAEHMETILMNMLDNAFRHTPVEGAVHLTAQHTGDQAEIAVRDDGPGIPEDEQDWLFGRFYQREAPSTRQGQTGIGLALTRTLVELHDGTIAVESAAGSGTLFRVRWPARTEDESIPSGTLADDLKDVGDSAYTRFGEARTSASDEDLPTPDAASDGASSESYTTGSDQSTVLVVDDNADMRSFVRHLLAPAYRVLEASDGEAGVETARLHLPDCIVADIMMPRMDGMEMLAALRDDDATACIPVVMLTALAETEHRVSGLDTGADAYVSKPFAPDVLQAHVQQRIVAQHRLRKRLQEGPQEETEAPYVPPAAPRDASSATASETAPPFLQTLENLMAEHFHDPDFGVEDMAEAVPMSRRSMERKLKEETDLTPAQFLRTYRLHQAARLLIGHEGTIAEVAYAVGFNSHSYFSRTFKKQFGCSPSAYVKKQEAQAPVE